MENNKKTTQDVVHIATPHDYFGEKLSDQPIFGIKDFGGLKFKPIRSAYNGRAVFYMTDKVRYGEGAPNLKSTISRDQWEYLRYAQLDQANKFEDTLAYREKMGKPGNKEVNLGLQYMMLGMLRYSNFNFIIDFNELNRISLAPEKEAREELFILIAAATQNINWAIIQNSNLKDKAPTLGRDLFLETFKFKKAPQLQIKDIDTYLYRYDFMRDEVLSGEGSTPWAPTPYQGLDTADIYQSFDKLASSCGYDYNSSNSQSQCRQ